MKNDESKEPAREEAVSRFKKRMEQKEEATISTLGPRDLGGIVNDTFRIYGRNFLRLITIVAIPEVILGILGYVLAQALILPVITSMGTITSLAPLIWVAVILVVVFILAYALMRGALIHAVSEQSLGRTIGIGRAYRFAWRRLGAMVGAEILAGLALLGLCITIIGIPFAIYFGVRWAFIVQAALLEGAGPRAALSRSSEIVQGEWGRVVGIMLVVDIIAGGIGFVLSLTVGLIPYAGTMIASILPTPIVITGATLLYYDLRVRKQGYNLEKMASELGIAKELSQTGMGPIKE